MFFKYRHIALILCFSLGFPSISIADFVLHFVNSDDEIVTALNVNPGESVSFKLILTQTNSETRLSDEGLNLFDASITSNNLLFGTPTGISLDAAFSESLLGASTFSAEDYEFHGTAPVLSPDSAVTPNFFSTPTLLIHDSILLGTGTYLVDSMATGTATLTAAGIPFDIFPSFVLAADNPVFATQFNPTPAMLTLQANAVPEPSSAVLIGLAIAVGGLRLRRRRV
ncbi:PEP-CTERM sorting domain-containing protein [Rubripirellula reticaptiva]|uniref:Ice-binding protein C-terminal domain-containing protein n=1 Tax=Rubripirellula reticaptiva TaxID=2528013 RepID=A0A5C6EDB8_9BACT|nr:PEP-CTERM sorting domain-containing protein [Rubripirellula reticaptiva]TWU47693.1 hypothetical protein Poly59_45340 [Rubripirellula reticaptiva]